MSNHPANMVENTTDMQPLPFTDYEYSQPKTYSGGNGTYRIDNPFNVDSEVMIGIYGCTDAGANTVVSYDIDPLGNIPLLAAGGLMGNQFKGVVNPQAFPQIFVPIKQYLVLNVQGITTGYFFITFYFRRHAIMYLPKEPQRKYFSDPSM